MLSARKMPEPIPVRVAAYFGLVIATLIMINTPIPRVALQVLLGEAAAQSMANSLRNLTRDIFLLLLVSIYFEWVRSRQQVALLTGLSRGMEYIQREMKTFSLHEAQRMTLDSMTGPELVAAGANKVMPKLHDTSTLTRLILSDRPHYDNVYISCRINEVGKNTVSLFQTFTRTALSTGY